jgi:5-methylcytosine-specific restriction protein A
MVTRLCIGCGKRVLNASFCAACLQSALPELRRRGSYPPPTGSGGRWQTIRAAILDRDGHRCVLCGAQATQVDHIVPRADGGDESPENLRSLCRRCHVRVTAAWWAQRRAWSKVRRAP